MSGWLNLTPQGLALQEAPSLLGALTAELSRAAKRRRLE